MKVFSRQIYSYNFHICKLNNLKVIDDLYSQCLTQTLSKTSSFTNMEGVSFVSSVKRTTMCGVSTPNYAVNVVDVASNCCA